MYVQVPANAKDSDRALRESIVIVLSGDDMKSGYRCVWRATESVTARLMVTPQGAKRVIKPDGGLEFVYAFPEDLVVLVEGKRIRLKARSEPQQIAEAASRLAVSVTVPSKTVRLHVTEGLDAELSEKIEGWEKALKRHSSRIKSLPLPSQCLLSPKRGLEETRTVLHDIEEKMEELEKKYSGKKRKDLPAVDREWASTLEKQKKDVETYLDVLEDIIRTRDDIVTRYSEKTIRFQSPSGHVVRQVTVGASWGNE